MNILTPRLLPEEQAPRTWDERPDHCRVTIVEPRFYGNQEVSRSDNRLALRGVAGSGVTGVSR